MFPTLPRETPTKEEIYKRAVELANYDKVKAGLPKYGYDYDPKVEKELKEGSYWDRAKAELMTGIRSQLEEYLHYLEEEAARVREELGIKPPPELPELERRLEAVEARYERAERQLKRAEAIEKVLRETLAKRERELEEARRRLEEKVRRYTYVTIRFKTDIPQFVGADLTTYGPYKAGDLASIPDLNAAILIEKGVAERWVAVPAAPPMPPDKARLRMEAKELWAEYREALRLEEYKRADEIRKRLAEIRKKIFP